MFVYTHIHTYPLIHIYTLTHPTKLKYTFIRDSLKETSFYFSVWSSKANYNQSSIYTCFVSINSPYYRGKIPGKNSRKVSRSSVVG